MGDYKNIVDKPGWHSSWSECIKNKRKSADVLKEFARLYYDAIYRYIRKAHKRRKTTAEDLTQGYFEWFLNHPAFLDGWIPERGKLRVFIKVSIRSYILRCDRTLRAQKRSGKVASLDSKAFADFDVEDKSAPDPAHDRIFNEEWFRQVYVNSMKRLHDIMANRGELDRYWVYEYAVQNPEATYREIAQVFGRTIPQVKHDLGVCSHWMLKIPGDYLDDSVATEDDAKEERHLYEQSDSRDPGWITRKEEPDWRSITADA